MSADFMVMSSVAAFRREIVVIDRLNVLSDHVARVAQTTGYRPEVFDLVKPPQLQAPLVDPTECDPVHCSLLAI